MKLFKEKHNGKTYFFGGLKRDKEDPRDFKLGGSLFGYTPKHEIHLIKTLDIKEQKYNSCTQESFTAQAEVEEGCVLSEQSFTQLCRESGVIRKDGFSSLKAIQQVGIKKGIAEKIYLNENDYDLSWNDYSNPAKLTPVIRTNAELHKSKNFAQIIGRYARLKELDEDFVLQTGLDWYSGFQSSGGFKYPWLITKNVGWKVGGHALIIKGYILKYKGIQDKQILTGDGGTNVYVFQQSAGKEWGATVVHDGVEHAGLFFVSMDFYDKFGHVAYKRIDLDANLDELIAQYEGKFVKGCVSAIYKIEDGKKRAFPDKLTFYSFGGRYGADGQNFLDIATSLLDKIPNGSDMTVEESPYWEVIKTQMPMIKTLAEPANEAKIQELIKAHLQVEQHYSSWDKFILNLSNMANKGKYGVLSSSANPENLSLTIKGILLALAPLIVALLTGYGYDITPETFIETVNLLSGIVGSGFAIYGIIRRVFKKEN